MDFRGFIVAAAKDAAPLLRQRDATTAHAIAGDMLHRAHTIASQLNAKLDPHFTSMPVCAEGCSYCCHQAVLATTPEVVALADALREGLAPAALAELRARIEKLARETRELTTLDWHLGKLACPLLDQKSGTCIAHDARPLNCRAHNSLDVEQCVAHFEGKNPDAEIKQNTFQVSGMKAAWMGTIAAVRAAGLDAEAYDLTQALAIALADDTIAERWAAGESPLAAARIARTAAYNKSYLPLYREALDAVAPEAGKRAPLDADAARRERNRRKKAAKR